MPTTLPTSAIIDHLPTARDAAHTAIDTDPQPGSNRRVLTPEEKQRWHTATDKAYSWLVEQDELIYDQARWELTMVSPDSGETYTANGACGCTAFAKHQACYHRSAARLVRRSLEAKGHSYGSADLGTRLATARRERVYSEIAELF